MDKDKEHEEAHHSVVRVDSSWFLGSGLRAGATS
jgi:hypothetical protein